MDIVANSVPIAQLGADVVELGILIIVVTVIEIIVVQIMISQQLDSSWELDICPGSFPFLMFQRCRKGQMYLLNWCRIIGPVGKPLCLTLFAKNASLYSEHPAACGALQNFASRGSGYKTFIIKS